MASHLSRNGKNSNQTLTLVQQGKSNSAGSEFIHANGLDNTSQPANRELERAFKIRMPQRTMRTELEKRRTLTSEMLQKAVTTGQLADLLQIDLKTLQNRINQNQVKDFPEFITLPGSKTRMFPVEWINEWRQQRTWIYGAVTKVQRF
jgi:hypothetical protein